MHISYMTVVALQNQFIFETIWRTAEIKIYFVNPLQSWSHCYSNLDSLASERGGLNLDLSIPKHQQFRSALHATELLADKCSKTARKLRIFNLAV